LDINSRFEILIFETAEEYLKRRKIELEKLYILVEKEKKRSRRKRCLSSMWNKNK